MRITINRHVINRMRHMDIPAALALARCLHARGDWWALGELTTHCGHYEVEAYFERVMENITEDDIDPTCLSCHGFSKGIEFVPAGPQLPGFCFACASSGLEQMTTWQAVRHDLGRLQ